MGSPQTVFAPHHIFFLLVRNNLDHILPHPVPSPPIPPPVQRIPRCLPPPPLHVPHHPLQRIPQVSSIHVPHQNVRHSPTRLGQRTHLLIRKIPTQRHLVDQLGCQPHQPNSLPAPPPSPRSV